MSNIFIIHGSFGNPNENWFPWLKSELENLNHRVFVPQFPLYEKQTLADWKQTISEYKKYLDKDSIFVGHSLGPVFLLSILEDIHEPIKASFFVAGFLNLLGNPTFDEVNKTFVKKNFDWQLIKKNCKKFYLFHSDNDPYVPTSEADELSKRLDVKSELVKNAGHFNKEAGYIKFDLLLDKIKSEIQFY